jgi:hypothetical protein
LLSRSTFIQRNFCNSKQISFFFKSVQTKSQQGESRSLVVIIPASQAGGRKFKPQLITVYIIQKCTIHLDQCIFNYSWISTNTWTETWYLSKYCSRNWEGGWYGKAWCPRLTIRLLLTQKVNTPVNKLNETGDSVMQFDVTCYPNKVILSLWHCSATWQKQLSALRHMARRFSRGTLFSLLSIVSSLNSNLGWSCSNGFQSVLAGGTWKVGYSRVN